MSAISAEDRYHCEICGGPKMPGDLWRLPCQKCSPEQKARAEIRAKENLKRNAAFAAGGNKVG